MGWVTLTLRKRELKQEHAYYQLRDLQISREKRQLARSKQYQTQQVQNEQQEKVNEERQNYNADRELIMSQMSSLRETAKKDGTDTNSATITTENGATVGMYELQNQLSQAQLDYTEQVNSHKTFYEQELAMIEEDASDQETALDMEQVEVESQMEAISQEMQAVSEAISSEIQSSTIKLA